MRVPDAPAARIYFCACIFALLFTLAHVVSLPVEITYDGLGYIDLADVLGSSRFPHDWSTNRTPLFPLLLKVSFWILGRQPLAIITLCSILGVTGVLALGSAVRRIAGDYAAAAAVVIVTLFPTFVTYEHSTLTEAGTFCFLALVLRASLMKADAPREAWRRTILLIAILSLGYYWRQNILTIAVVAAAALGIEEWLSRGKPARTGILLRMALIVVVPYVLSWPWSPYLDPSGLRDVTLHQGMIRQALLPPEDPYVGENAALYAQAIQESIRNNNFYSGVTWDRLLKVSEPIFSKPIPQGTPRFFLELMWRYPRRYVAGFGRTVLLFAGVPGVESDNRSFREEVLSLTLPGSKIGDGPQPLQSKIKQQFQQTTTPSVILRGLRVLSPAYDGVLVWATLMTAVGLLAAFWLRDAQLFVMCALPLVHLLGYAVLLTAIDRFMVPVYPIMLANLVLVPARVWQQMKRAGTGDARSR